MTTIELPERWGFSVGNSAIVRQSKGGHILAVLMENANGRFNVTYIDRRTNERSALATDVGLNAAITTVEDYLVAIAEGRA